MNKIKLYLSIILIVCLQNIINAQETEIQVSKIWDQGKHNAFPDLFQYKKYFYVAFREGNSHVDNLNNGKVRLIRSTDLKNWETIELFEMDGVDIREARLSKMPDGTLLVTLAAGVWKDGQYLSLSPYVSFSDKKGENFSVLTKTEIDSAIKPALDWIWRVTWHKNTGYGILYQIYPGQRNTKNWNAFLVKTSDGIKYEKVSQLNIDGNPNESTIRIDNKGKMYVLVRRESADQMGVLAKSDFPYVNWNFNKLTWRLGGPNFLFLNNDQLIIGSRYREDKSAITALLVTDLNGNVQKIVRLPSSGDTSYPGMIIHKKQLLVVYYSSHEGKSNIYLASIPLKNFNIKY